jgi:hypothetical protein
MNIPKTLKIGGHKYKVLYPYHFKERIDCNGQNDPALLEIRITNCDEGGNTRGDSNISVTFLHEIIHLIDNIYCSRQIDRLGSEAREQIVEGLSEGLYQVLHDNKLSF